MKEVTIGVYHQDCWGSDSSEKFPTSKGTIVSPITLNSKKDKISVNSTFDTKFTDKKDLEGFIEYSKKHPIVKKFDVIHKTNNRLMFNVVFEGTSSYDAVFHNNVIYTSPITQEKGGLEVHRVLIKNPKETTNLLKELEILGEVKVLKTGKPSFEENPYNLTDKQAQALRIARASGYYSWPRHIGLRELAETCGTTRRAFQENLRKAEAKVFPEFLNRELSI